VITKLPHNKGFKLRDDQPLLVVRELSFTYPPPRRTHALRNISLTVQGNEFVGIIGQNGSGKTTLTKCISGHLRPANGKVLIQDREVSQVPIRERPRFVGYTFQNPDDQLFMASVWDDIRFGLENLGYDRDTTARAAEEMLRDLGLWDKRDLHPYRLSKGDRQRLSIAVMAVMQPAILIVDEPTTGQDPVRARQIMDLLLHLQRDLDMTIVVVTHAMDLVADYCNRVIAMHQGEILIDGEPGEVFAQTDVLAKTFVQPPPVARLALRLGMNPVPVNVEQAVQMFYQLLSHESKERGI